MIECARCGHDYQTHAPGGGPCAGCQHEHPDGMTCLGEPVCSCPGFLWVDPAGSSGSYGSRS